MLSNLKKQQTLFLLIAIIGISLLNSCKTTQTQIAKAPGIYIKKYMDKEAFEIQKAIKYSKVERIGDSIKVTFVNEVFFDHNQFEIKAEAESSLRKLADILLKYTKTYNIIQGHTDNTGSDEYNLTLSFRRAAAVHNFLEKANIKNERLTSYGVGDTQPMASNETEEGRSKNRRVVIWITADYVLKEEAISRSKS